MLDLAPGNTVQFCTGSGWWKVRRVSPDGRYAICTRPHFDTVRYCILDAERQVRGPDNRVFCFGYETEEDIDANMADLQRGDLEVSWRTGRSVPLDIRRVRGKGRDR